MKEKEKRTDDLVQVRVTKANRKPRTVGLHFGNVPPGEEMLALQEMFEAVLTEVFGSTFHVSIIEEAGKVRTMYCDPVDLIGGRRLRRQFRDYRR